MPDDLLPPNATLPERALSLATGRDVAVPIKELWSPMTCPAAVLPWLAWALSVDEWDTTWPVEMQRQVIAESISHHRKKGTVGALKRALQRLGYEVEIDERTGDAYTFKLRFKVGAGESAGGSVIESAVQRATTIALQQKNARSFLAESYFLADTDPAHLYSGGIHLTGIECQINPRRGKILAQDGVAILAQDDSFIIEN